MSSDEALLRKNLNAIDKKVQLKALKQLTQQFSAGSDCSAYFPDVIKLVATNNVIMKRLSYMFIAQYSEAHPDVAIMCFNIFQKELTENKDQLIRAMALRTMSNMRVLDIQHLVVMSIEKAASDPSPFVRKTAAQAAVKVHQYDPTHDEELIPVIEQLFKDKFATVLGSTAAAFNLVCPHMFEIIHPHFKKLCQLVADCDEWSQIEIIKLLTKYARNQFADPLTLADAKEEDGEEAKAPEKEGDFFDESANTHELSADHRLLLRGIRWLLRSRNPGVVLEAVQFLYYCAPRSVGTDIALPLIRLLHHNNETDFYVLSTIRTLAGTHPHLFQPYLTFFYVRITDDRSVRDLKLRLLTTLADEETFPGILREFKACCSSLDPVFASDAIAAIGRMAVAVPITANDCITTLFTLLHRPDTVNASTDALRYVALSPAVEDSSFSVPTMVRRLAKILAGDIPSDTKAAILGLLCERMADATDVCPDVLRSLCADLPRESDDVKLQVLNLVSRVYLKSADVADAVVRRYSEHADKLWAQYDSLSKSKKKKTAEPAVPRLDAMAEGEMTGKVIEQIRLMFEYITAVLQYDSYDIRSKLRLITSLVGKDGMDELMGTSTTPTVSVHDVQNIFFAVRPAIDYGVTADSGDYRFGTVTSVIGRPALGYERLEAWPEVPPDPSVRVVVEEPKFEPAPPVESAESSSSDEEETHHRHHHEKKHEKKAQDDDDFWGSITGDVKPQQKTPESDSEYDSQYDSQYDSEYDSQYDSESSDDARPAPTQTVSAPIPSKPAAAPAPMSAAPPKNALDDLLNGLF
ncbi:Adaptor Protein Complex 3 subunit, beta (AP3B) [Carpediemonas membranifera]|uniref:Adaptor Protein Complex 3 subunit, beta (AP3B) n=1 Tax=Carpediemonas membranifera TaxID=201153 RepID=A0A8J6ASY1_9EUKA|nr:Adaptor Protein Complex 3 subunit, beta (AP3B) [Carpediemonas membranifera]|eukprot:KAG9391595.1 Adaptor Protein Complex 3 subunit, beta (AP3B) [Carpediemonas membranifera]